MAIDNPVSDLGRAISHEPDLSWPTSVRIELRWVFGDEVHISFADISADQFFGRGTFGAPLPGDAVIGMIENMRRAGPDTIQPRKPNAKGKASRKR